MKNVLKSLAKRVSIPLGLTAAVSAIDAAIHKKVFGPGRPRDLSLCVTTLISSNKEINDIMKIVNSLEESDLLIKYASETIKNEAKEQKGRFLGMLLGTSGASLLGNLFTGKGAIATSQGRGTNRAGEGTFRAGEGTVRADQDF